MKSKRIALTFDDKINDPYHFAIRVQDYLLVKKSEGSDELIAATFNISVEVVGIIRGTWMPPPEATHPISPKRSQMRKRYRADD